MINKKISERIYTIKAICILLVVCAHMTSNNLFCQKIMTILSVLAVPMFFFLSGFFYNYDNSLKTLILKVKKLCIPWWIWGIVTYCISIYVNSFSFSVQNMILYVLGKGSLYYYLSMLIILYFIFKYKNTVKFCILCIIFNFISYIAYAYKIFGEIEFDMYLNIFNWCGFFAFGILVKKLNLLNKILIVCDKYSISIFILFILFSIFRIKFDLTLGYFGKGALVGGILGEMLILALSKYLNVPYIINLGKETLIIYLMHIQVAGIFNTRLPNLWVIDILKPCLVLFVIYTFWFYMKKIFTKSCFKLFLSFLGLREEKCCFMNNTNKK